MIKGGYTVWARKTFDSDIFIDKPDKWFKIWFYLVNRAECFSNKKYARGSKFIKYSQISEKTGANKNEIDHSFRWFKKCEMLATQKATHGVIIFILNYDKYQKSENYKSDNKSDLKAKQKRQHIYKEIKEIKEETNKDINVFLSSFNEKFKSHYQNTKGREIKFNLRLKKFTLEEILKALDNLSKSEFHQGDNDRGWKADPDFLIRNDEQIDKWLNNNPEKTKQPINNLLKGTKNYEDFKRGL